MRGEEFDKNRQEVKDIFTSLSDRSARIVDLKAKHQLVFHRLWQQLRTRSQANHKHEEELRHREKQKDQQLLKLIRQNQNIEQEISTIIYRMNHLQEQQNQNLTEYIKNPSNINYTDANVKSHVAAKMASKYLDAASEFYVQRDRE